MNFIEWKNKYHGLFVGLIFMLVCLFLGWTKIGEVLLFMFMLFFSSLASDFLLLLGCSENSTNFYCVFFYIIVYLLLLICFLFYVRFNETNAKKVLILFFIIHFFVAGTVCYFLYSITTDNWIEIVKQGKDMDFVILQASVFYPILGILYDLIINLNRNKLTFKYSN